MKNDTMDNRPRAVASGTIFGGVDCYVFADGSTALSQRGMLRGLRGKDGAKGGAEDGDLGRYLARLPEKYSGLAAAPIPFLTQDGNEAIGRPSRDFVAMCRAYAEMYAEGSIHKARIPIARNCIAILAALADIGIDELVYRASDWHPAPLAVAPTVDLASLRDSLRADLSAEFAPVLSRLAALESQGALVLGNTGPSIGDATADIYVRHPVQEIARTLAKAVKNDTPAAVKSLRFKTERDLRAAVDFPMMKGMGWHAFPTARLGELGIHLNRMLTTARGLAQVSIPKPVQLSLVANGNGAKKSG